MRRRTLMVWDLPTRLLHLLLLAGVVGAWLTAGHARMLAQHVAAGWLVGVALGLRLLWGLVGTRHARWRTFLVPWRQVRERVRGLVRGDAPRTVGHNPLASWAMLGGLALLGLSILTGVLVQGGEEQEGLLAGHLSVAQGVALHEPHRLLAWLLLGWIGLHLAGVIEESLRTRENLALAMVDGRKRPQAGVPAVPTRAGVALVGLLLVALACMGPLVPTQRAEPADTTVRLATDPVFESECGDCHMAWHPSLLPARSWVLLMATQSDHFGEDLFLSPALAGQIQDFLVRNAAELSQSEAAFRVATTTPPEESPLRITLTPMWIEAHADISEDSFRAEPVGSASRCEACHEDATTGVFANRAITPPEQLELP